jgi:hypothetical protein
MTTLDPRTELAILVAFVQWASIAVLCNAWRQDQETVEQVLRDALIDVQTADQPR